MAEPDGAREFSDAGEKDIVRTTLKVVETRSGKDIQYQDEEARKQMGGGK